MTLPDPAQSLPHGPGFRFVSRLKRFSDGVCGAGGWILQATEGFFAGHVNGRPVVPDVLPGGALAQWSVIVAFAGTPGRQAGIAALDLRTDPPKDVKTLRPAGKRKDTRAP